VAVLPLVHRVLAKVAAGVEAAVAVLTILTSLIIHIGLPITIIIITTITVTITSDRSPRQLLQNIKWIGIHTDHRQSRLVTTILEFE
jgi:hypothetical protein